VPTVSLPSRMHTLLLAPARLVHVSGQRLQRGFVSPEHTVLFLARADFCCYLLWCSQRVVPRSASLYCARSAPQRRLTARGRSSGEKWCRSAGERVRSECVCTGILAVGVNGRGREFDQGRLIESQRADEKNKKTDKRDRRENRNGVRQE